MNKEKFDRRILQHIFMYNKEYPDIYLFFLVLFTILEIIRDIFISQVLGKCEEIGEEKILRLLLPKNSKTHLNDVCKKKLYCFSSSKRG